MTAALRPTTISALRSISAAILLDPKSYHQELFVTNFETEQEAGCVAYHHARLHRTKKQLSNLMKKHRDWHDSFSGFDENPFFTAARKDLKLNEDQAFALLGGINRWPMKYMDAYENAKGPKGRARALHNRIEFFISSDGTDKTDKELSTEAKVKNT